MNLFAGAWEARDVSPLPVDIPLATDTQVSSSQILLLEISGFFIELLIVDRITVTSDDHNFAFFTFTN